LPATPKPLRFICIGAHPDDCEIGFGGAAVKLAAQGRAVKFLTVTNGDAGHHKRGGPELASIRAEEMRESARRLGIAASEALPNHDGELLPSLEIRRQIVTRIRDWQADVVLTHRPVDYHPDHRYTAQLVQDSAYLVLVPNICPEIPPLERNPIYLYLEDSFERPVTFRPDVAVAIDDVWERKIAAMDAHVSQFYEWLPWIDRELDRVPPDPARRPEWLSQKWTRPVSPAARETLIRRYGSKAGSEIRRAESFELCEYGTRPSPEELNRIFPL